MNPNPQIFVLDAGGQYCHLIARKVRDLGVYAEVRPSETPAAELAGARGIVISGGPASVYDPDSPTVDPAIFSTGQAVLGICYGQQLMAHLLGGDGHAEAKRASTAWPPSSSTRPATRCSPASPAGSKSG